MEVKARGQFLRTHICMNRPKKFVWMCKSYLKCMNDKNLANKLSPSSLLGNFCYYFENIW